MRKPSLRRERPDGTLVDSGGETFSGRPAIEAAYAEFFRERPGAKIEVTIDSVRMLGSDAAIEEGHASVSFPSCEGSGSARYTAVHVKQDGQWLMAMVHETPATASSSQLADLDWMVGSWSAEERGATSNVTCQSLANKTFLERKYMVTAADRTTTSGVQLIGLDPRTGGIVSWGFNSDGGRTIGTWMPHPNGWAIESVGLSADGSRHASGERALEARRECVRLAIGRSQHRRAIPPNVDEIVFRAPRKRLRNRRHPARTPNQKLTLA